MLARLTLAAAAFNPHIIQQYLAFAQTGYLVINLLDLFLHMRLSDFWLVWMAPELLAWYWLARRQTMDSKQKIAAPSTIVDETHDTTK